MRRFRHLTRSERLRSLKASLRLILMPLSLKDSISWFLIRQRIKDSESPVACEASAMVKVRRLMAFKCPSILRHPAQRLQQYFCTPSMPTKGTSHSRQSFAGSSYVTNVFRNCIKQLSQGLPRASVFTDSGTLISLPLREALRAKILASNQGLMKRSGSYLQRAALYTPGVLGCQVLLRA